MPAGDGAPRTDRESLGSSPVVSWVSCLLMNARLPSDFCGARLSSAPPPPPPFLVQPYLSRDPPNQRESIFVVFLLALSPSVPPGLGPSDLLTAVMDPFHFHPPPSYAMLMGRSHLALIGIWR